jgi:hypothetical protein
MGFHGKAIISQSHANRKAGLSVVNEKSLLHSEPLNERNCLFFSRAVMTRVGSSCTELPQVMVHVKVCKAHPFPI